MRTELVNPLKSSLLSIYPEKEGWKLYNRYNWATRIFDFVLQKEENGVIERILVEMNFENHISREHFSNLTSLAKRLSSGGCCFIKKVMVVDEMATFDRIPADVEIISLRKLLSSTLLAYEPINPKLVA